jgi:hypothetical protein
MADSPDSAKSAVRRALNEAQSTRRKVEDALPPRGSLTLDQAAGELAGAAILWGQDLQCALLKNLAREGLPPEQFTSAPQNSPQRSSRWLSESSA